MITKSSTKSQIARKEFVPGTSRGRRSLRTLALQMAMEAEKQAAVGRRLKELRGARTQQAIADYVGVTLRAYQAWEAGDSGISWPHIEKLAAYHQVSENFILYGQDESPAVRQTQLDHIEKMLTEIHAALLGDVETGVDGLADRLLRARKSPRSQADGEPPTLPEAQQQ